MDQLDVPAASPIEANSEVSERVKEKSKGNKAK
jgi:hypothetical protein